MRSALARASALATCAGKAKLGQVEGLGSPSVAVLMRVWLLLASGLSSYHTLCHCGRQWSLSYVRAPAGSWRRSWHGGTAMPHPPPWRCCRSAVSPVLLTGMWIVSGKP